MKVATKNGLKFGILVASDTRSARKNAEMCIPAISAFVKKRGHSVAISAVCPDEMTKLRKTISTWAKSGKVDVILTSGGTGVSPRDVTPEATKPLLERELPGIPEAMRAASMKITANAVISRAVAGLIGTTLVVNLPGSPSGAVENLEAVHSSFTHIIKKAKGDPEQCGVNR